MYAVHLTFKNVKSTPVNFEYQELIENDNGQYKIVLKGADDQRKQIQVTPDGIEIQSKNSADDQHSMLAANGGEQTYESEVHLSFSKKNDSSRKRRREK